MKHLVLVFLFNTFSLWLTSQVLPTLVIGGGWQTLVLAGAVLSILNLLVRPFLKILFLPINFLTFGLLSWIINVLVIYLLTILVSAVEIVPWTFPGWSWSGFVIPPLHLSYLPALILSSLLVTLLADLFESLSES